MRFVITGKAWISGQWVYRDDLKALAHKQGHGVDHCVLPDTDYLVTDDPGRMTQKRRDAALYGIPILTSDEFLDMMGGEIELSSTLGVKL
jgi:NAD-dependent DNA ligase